MLAALRRFFARCLPSSLAGRAAAVTAILLIVTVLVAFAVFFIRSDLVDLEHVDWSIPLILLLVVMASIIVYFLISRWGVLVTWSPYPDIDSAWSKGIDALDHAGLSIKSVPIFLLLGSTGGQLEDAIVQALKAAGVKFKVENVPDGEGVDHALRWYVTNDAAYVFCSDVGAISKLARAWSTFDISAELDAALPIGFPGPPAPKAAVRFTETLRPGSLDAAVSADVAGTSAGTAWVDEQDSSVTRLPSVVNLDKETLRLEYLCELLKRQRRPLCGVNGVVALLPYELVGAGGRDVQILTDAIKLDLSTVGETLRLRFPISALVVGVEKAKGFGKFVGMLKPEQLAQRLGKRFETRQLPTDNRLKVLAVDICNAFEDWVYFLYSRPDALDQSRENVKLYGLLCRARKRLKPKLYQVLGNAFNLSEDDPQSAFFTGCYLSATGHTPDQQAFIKGIHDKLLREQSTVEWTKRALAVDSAFRIATQVGWLVLAVTLFFLVAVLVGNATV